LHFTGKNTDEKYKRQEACTRCAPLGAAFSIPGHHGRYRSGLYPSAAETGSQAADTTGRAQCGYVYFAGIERQH
jgi:hypothetical protein